MQDHAKVHQQSWAEEGSPQPCVLYLDRLRSCLGPDLQASTGAYQLSMLWKGLRDRKGARDWEATGFI